MTDVQITPSLRSRRELGAWTDLRAWSDRIAPKTVIIALAILALALRLYYVTRPGFLFGVTEYDDGSYFGSAVRLVHGQLPYRDFVFVQPPGITLLMAPVALIAKVTGTAWGLALGRILTVLVGTAGVVLTGLLVRHRGVLAVLLSCGICAVHPDSIAAAHTVLVEPWLVMFCLIGALAMFDGDRLATGRRVFWGGVAFGFAGVIEAWAIVPVLILIALSARAPRRAATLAAGVAAGFLIPTVPFAVLAPRNFYQSVIVAQVGHRENASRVYGLYRLRLMAGVSDILHPANALVIGVVLLIVGLVIGGTALACWKLRELPSALEWFVVTTGGLMAVIFLWPPQFHYHFVGFLAPFLAMSIALATVRVMTAIRPLAQRHGISGPLRWGVSTLVVVGILLASAIEVSYERTLHTTFKPSQLTAVQRVIPPGACVLADEVAYAIVANRFISNQPDCPAIDDGTGVNYALSHGLNTETGAAGVPAVAALWESAFAHSQFIWLSFNSDRRVPWTPALVEYFNAHFVPVQGLTPGLGLFERKH
jgi:hypothetical protein